jgi:hypothetical protein
MAGARVHNRAALPAVHVPGLDAEPPLYVGYRAQVAAARFQQLLSLLL